AVSTTPNADFAGYWADDRLRPLADNVTRTLGADGHDTVDEAIDIIADGAFDGVSGQGEEEPARVHGDLWSGNVMWTADGATLIDPAAHGGHRLEDLAMLSLFGAPLLEEIFEGYEAEHPLPGDWQQDLPAHLFFGLLAHVRIFGEAYVDQTIATAEAIIDRADPLGFCARARSGDVSARPSPGSAPASGQRARRRPGRRADVVREVGLVGVAEPRGELGEVLAAAQPVGR